MIYREAKDEKDRPVRLIACHPDSVMATDVIPKKLVAVCGIEEGLKAIAGYDPALLLHWLNTFGDLRAIDAVDSGSLVRHVARRLLEMVNGQGGE